MGGLRYKKNQFDIRYKLNFVKDLTSNLLPDLLPKVIFEQGSVQQLENKVNKLKIG